MADKTMGGSAHGSAHGGDQTAMPGQAAGKLPFGAPNSLSTGAPGSGGTGPAGDPTLQSPVSGSVFGAATDDTATGAPGSSGAHGTTSGGASFTLDTYGWHTQLNMTGGSVDTESQANKYGTDTGIPGLHTPKSTGAGGGPISHDHTGA